MVVADLLGVVASLPSRPVSIALLTLNQTEVRTSEVLVRFFCTQLISESFFSKYLVQVDLGSLWLSRNDSLLLVKRG